MDVSIIIKAMENDLGVAAEDGIVTPKWFDTLHPSIFTRWSTPLSVEPTDVVDAILSQRCPAHVAAKWWRRYGFLLSNAEELFMLLDRDGTLETWLSNAVEGSIWRVARGYMMVYSANEHVPMTMESIADMARTRACAKRLWSRLWTQPSIGVQSPDLHDLILAHPTTVSSLWAEEPEEAYLAQLGAVAFVEKRHRVCFYNMLLATFPQHQTAIRWLEHEGTSSDEAWKATWQLVQGSRRTQSELPPVDLVDTVF